jgi:hypothetical protein
VVLAVWAGALTLWAWLVVVGAVHGWASRQGRSRVTCVTRGLLPVSLRRRVEGLALAGLLVVPAACATPGRFDAPVLVLEEVTPLLPDQPAPPSPGSSTTTTQQITTRPPSSRPPTAAPLPPTTRPTPPPPTPTRPADPPTAESPMAPPVPSLPAADEADVHVVISGDSLWSIAEDHLARRHDGPPSDRLLLDYWRSVIEANRNHLRSGDPDLIHPGERVRLPPLPGEVAHHPPAAGG